MKHKYPHLLKPLGTINQNLSLRANLKSQFRNEIPCIKTFFHWATFNFSFLECVHWRFFSCTANSMRKVNTSSRKIPTTKLFRCLISRLFWQNIESILSILNYKNWGRFYPCLQQWKFWLPIFEVFRNCGIDFRTIHLRHRQIFTIFDTLPPPP